jgi:7,8-dihydropterin-6-yl-methyl-4-(beta-D-ribofuranosyl)aminobenzene 5'-phosphate synthase
VQVTIIYDNETWQPGLQADWGLSCLVALEERRFLFDTGAKGTVLLANMQALDFDPHAITDIFISHAHWDHMGGLPDLLSLIPDVRVYLPGSCSPPPEAREVIRVQGPLEISENFFSTGELAATEQSLVVKTAKGLAVICGCSHPGVGAILKAASRFGRISALIGGLHGFQEYELLANLDLVCPCHCTQHKAEILTRYPDTAISGGAGKAIHLG